MAEVDIDAIIAQVMGQVAQLRRDGRGASLSERTYADEPILRRGSDLARQRKDRPPVPHGAQADKAQARPTGTQTPPAGQADGRGGRLSQGGHPAESPTNPYRGTSGARAGEASFPYRTHTGAASSAYGSRPSVPTSPQAGRSAWPWPPAHQRAQDAATASSLDWEGLPSYGRPRQAPRPQVDLPSTLRDLRALEGSRDAAGRPLRGVALFQAQAALAQAFEDDCPFEGIPSYQYQPTYQSLSDAELRGYFTWRALWRGGRREGLPLRTTYVLLLAYELVSGIDAPGADPFASLVDLRDLCRQADADGCGPGVSSDLDGWVRDYAICHGLDPSLAVGDQQRALGRAVATLRQAERAIECADSLHGLTPADSPGMPTEGEVWEALGALSSYSPAHSPFLRTHEEAAAAVGTGVFRRLVVHCAKRRKTDFVDGLVGAGSLVPYRPFLGVPVQEPAQVPGLPLQLTESMAVVERYGRRWLELGYDRAGKSRDLGKVLRGIDRQMRIDWDFPRPLKERPLPRYLQTMVTKESAARRQEEQEAERRRITIDVSQLGHIRQAAAATREALLVDEEREGWAPEGDREALAAAGRGGGPREAGQHPADQPTLFDGDVPEASPKAATWPGTSPDTGAQATPTNMPAAPAVPVPTVTSPALDTSPNPCGLTDAQLAFARAVLEGAPPPLPAGTTADLMVDAVNDALFDDLGDVAFEFGDEGPHPVEDYLDDLRGLLRP